MVEFRNVIHKFKGLRNEIPSNFDFIGGIAPVHHLGSSMNTRKIEDDPMHSLVARAIFSATCAPKKMPFVSALYRSYTCFDSIADVEGGQVFAYGCCPLS